MHFSSWAEKSLKLSVPEHLKALIDMAAFFFFFLLTASVFFHVDKVILCLIIIQNNNFWFETQKNLGILFK